MEYLLKIKDILRSDLTFLIPFGIWGYFSIFQKSLLYPKIEFFYLPLTLLCMTIIGLHELMYVKKYKWKDVLALPIVLFMMFICFKLQKGIMMFTVYSIYCARHTDLKKLAITCLIFCSLAMITIIGCTKCGIVQDYILIYEKRRPRHYLGFVYTLEAPAIYFNICAIWIYIRQNRITIIENVLLIIGAIFLYNLTDARLSLIFTCLLVILSLFLKYNYKFCEKRILIKWIMSFSIILSMIGSYAITMNYSQDNEILFKIDQKLSGRLRKGQESINTNGFNLLENDIEFIGNGMNNNGTFSNAKDNYVDNFYIQYAQVYGLIFFGMLVAIYTLVLIKANINNQIYLLVILTLFALHGIIDDLIIPLFYNFALLGSVELFKNEMPTI